LPIHASVVASKHAHADDRDVDAVVSCQ